MGKVEVRNMVHRFFTITEFTMVFAMIAVIAVNSVLTMLF